MLCPRNSLPRATDEGGADSEPRDADELWEGRGQLGGYPPTKGSDLEPGWGRWSGLKT